MIFVVFIFNFQLKFHKFRSLFHHRHMEYTNCHATAQSCRESKLLHATHDQHKVSLPMLFFQQEQHLVALVHGQNEPIALNQHYYKALRSYDVEFLVHRDKLKMKNGNNNFTTQLMKLYETVVKFFFQLP